MPTPIDDSGEAPYQILSLPEAAPSEPIVISDADADDAGPGDIFEGGIVDVGGIVDDGEGGEGGEKDIAKDEDQADAEEEDGGFGDGKEGNSPNNPGEYEIERVLDMKVDEPTGVKMYLIRWKGFDSDEDTWETAQNLSHCTTLLRRFESSHPLSLIGERKSMCPAFQRKAKPRRASTSSQVTI